MNIIAALEIFSSKELFKYLCWFLIKHNKEFHNSVNWWL